MGAAFIGKSRALEKCGDAHVKTVCDKDVGRQAKRIRIARKKRGSKEIGLLVSSRRLRKFKFKIPPILEPGFIGECGSERRIKFGDAPSIPYVIVPKAGDANRVAGLGLDAGRRSPTHAVDFKRGMVLQVNLPINLGKEDRRLTFAWHRPEFSKKSIETVGVVGLGLCSGDAKPCG